MFSFLGWCLGRKNVRAAAGAAPVCVRAFSRATKQIATWSKSAFVFYLVTHTQQKGLNQQ